jgi:hypothetical protein
VRSYPTCSADDLAQDRWAQADYSAALTAAGLAPVGYSAARDSSAQDARSEQAGCRWVCQISQHPTDSRVSHCRFDPVFQQPVAHVGSAGFLEDPCSVSPAFQEALS